MIKRIFAFLPFVLIGFAFGQQALWTTMERKDIKHIPYDSAIKEVAEFYNIYKFYFDHTGYSKEKIKEMLPVNDTSDKKDWDKIMDLKDKTVFAIRAPIESGSAVCVLCINKDSFHMVIFSNVYGPGANMTYNGELEKDRKRFEKWFKTLLD